MARNKKEKSGMLPAEDLHKNIQQKAYELWQKKGCSHGSDWTDWFEAEKSVKNK